MKKKIVYTDEPMGDVELVADFLPSPAELAFREDGVKVTLALRDKGAKLELAPFGLIPCLVRVTDSTPAWY